MVWAKALSPVGQDLLASGAPFLSRARGVVFLARLGWPLVLLRTREGPLSPTSKRQQLSPTEGVPRGKETAQRPVSLCSENFRTSLGWKHWGCPKLVIQRKAARTGS